MANGKGSNNIYSTLSRKGTFFALLSLFFLPSPFLHSTAEDDGDYDTEGESPSTLYRVKRVVKVFLV